MRDCVLRRFEAPDETRTFERGSLRLIRIAGTTLGRARYIGPGHDSWVVGDQPNVSIHLMGAEQYAT